MISNKITKDARNTLCDDGVWHDTYLLETIEAFEQRVFSLEEKNKELEAKLNEIMKVVS